ncbi:hypothetical protein Trydic_g18759 [Trypoxylus dichotomus]
MADPRLKTIKIKTGVVKRLAKEKVVYEREAETQQQRIERYKKEGKDEYDVRKQEEVLQECLMMLPDCQRRLKTQNYNCQSQKMSNCPNPNEYPNYTADIQTNYYNYNALKYQQPSFHTVDPRLNFVNKAPVYVSEQVPQIYYPESQVKYDLTLPSPQTEIEQKTDDELYIETWLSKIEGIQEELRNNVETISSADWKKKTIDIGNLKEKRNAYANRKLEL